MLVDAIFSLGFIAALFCAALIPYCLVVILWRGVTGKDGK